MPGFSATAAAILLRQADMNEQSLAELLQDCLSRPGQLAAMAEAAAKVATPEAAAAVSDRCEELMHGH